jgi:hypothetical protein
MYEIHRVYVKSTARIYEIYQSTDTMGASKDYLCTVRCGLAAKEQQPSGEESDDSWVDVKILKSPKRNKTSELQERHVAGTCQKDNLVIPPLFLIQNELWFIPVCEIYAGNCFDCDI